MISQLEVQLKSSNSNHLVHFHFSLHHVFRLHGLLWFNKHLSSLDRYCYVNLTPAANTVFTQTLNRYIHQIHPTVAHTISLPVAAHTHRHQDLFALVEQDGVLQRAVRDGPQRAASRRQGGQVEVEEPLDLAERQHVVPAEGGAHKVLQLRPVRRVSVLRVGGTRVTVDGAVGDGRGGASGL